MSPWNPVLTDAERLRIAEARIAEMEADVRDITTERNELLIQKGLWRALYNGVVQRAEQADAERDAATNAMDNLARRLTEAEEERDKWADSFKQAEAALEKGTK